MTMIDRARRGLALAVVALLAGGLWSATSSHAATSGVEIRDFSFQPADLTVRVGDTVTWTNRDGEAHAVQGGPLSSPDIQPNQSYSHTFSEVGDVTYICRIHTYMSGVVHVTAGGAPSTTSTTAAPTTTSTTAAPTSTTTAPHDGSTTTSSTTPGETTTTTAPPPPPPSGGRSFQDVPNDPSASYPPGHPRANDPPPSSAPSSTTTTTRPDRPPRSFQDVPNEPPPSFRAASAPTPALLAALTAADDDGSGTDLGDGTVLAPYDTTSDGVKVFHLTMAEATIEVAPGVLKPAYAFNGVVPGPVLRVNEGDRVRFVVKNDLPFSTGVHWHGMILPNDQDGVPGITQEAIEPGDTYTYEWTAVATGTHWYHSHSSGRHIGKGLYGALEVVPKLGDIASDRDYRVMLGDTDLGFVLNGRSFPSTPTLAAAVGEKVRIRVINAGDQIHAMHLHGTPFRVMAQDGMPRQLPEGMDTVTVSPGQTYDLVAEMPSAGQWLFHCHIFGHSHESMDEHPAGHSGMTGMVLILNVVEGGGGPLSLGHTVPLSSSVRTLPPAGDVAGIALGAALIAALGTPLVRRRPRPAHSPMKEH